MNYWESVRQICWQRCNGNVTVLPSETAMAIDASDLTFGQRRQAPYLAQCIESVLAQTYPHFGRIALAGVESGVTTVEAIRRLKPKIGSKRTVRSLRSLPADFVSPAKGVASRLMHHLNHPSCENWIKTFNLERDYEEYHTKAVLFKEISVSAKQRQRNGGGLSLVFR
jgi:hypothetical protein